MKSSTTNKYDLALHGVPLCAVRNKPVERMEWEYIDKLPQPQLENR